MNRKGLILVLVAIFLALASVPLAVAGPSHGRHHMYGASKFQLNGAVVSVDPAAGALVVAVKNGDRTVKLYRGHDVGLTVAPDARFVDGAASGSAFALGDLRAGDRVHVGGRVDGTGTATVLTAGKVIRQKAALAAAQP